MGEAFDFDLDLDNMSARRLGGRRRIGLALASLGIIAALGVGLGAVASAEDSDPIASLSTQASSTLDGLQAAEQVTGTAPDRTAPVDPVQAGELGLTSPATVDVRVLWYRTTYRSELAELANLVAARVEVDPQAMLDAWVAAGDERMRVVLSALGQLSDPYLWGSDGPDSFDCSGLTRFAWASVGVKLPHWSLAQANSGEPVDPAVIKPGDLVHRPGHIMMALGVGDTIVQSTNGVLRGVQLGHWGAADAFTDPLAKRTVRWRVADPIAAADPIAGADPAPAPAETPAAPVETPAETTVPANATP